MRDEQGKERDEDEELTGHEEYFENHYYLLGSKNGSEITLPPGEHLYPFTCVLPQNLPSSFEGEFGHIRYTIKVVLDRPWKFDQETKMAFTVITPLDLNRDPDMKVCLLFFKSFGVWNSNNDFSLFWRRIHVHWIWRKISVAFAVHLDHWKQWLQFRAVAMCPANQFPSLPRLTITAM